MGFFRVYEKSSKQNKKPGWQQKQAEYDAWLKGVQSQTTSFARTAKPRVVKKVEVVVPDKPIISPDRVFKDKSLGSFVTGGTKTVARPELQYRDNPELLQRELIARERKFNVAPAYNKGGDVFVTEAELANQLRGNKRRP